jgi:acetyltransferase-like isoleucine patch superfamily enzyme
MFLTYIYKAIRKIKILIFKFFGLYLSKLLFKFNGVKLGKSFTSNGLPIISVNGTMKIGKGFKVNNGKRFNQIGRQQQCMLIVSKGAVLEIGDNVGISSTAIICQKKIQIGNNVKIGGNTVIYDTDFHSLDYRERCRIPEEKKNISKKAVIIEDNAFIGAHSTILKGVHIGKNAIIGACSVVTKDVPPNQIWAGNPAKFIREILN